MSQRTVVPLFVRLFEPIPVAPIWVGLALLATLLLASSALLALLGLSFGERWIEFELTQLVTLAYLPTAAAYALRGARRELFALRPVLDLSEEELAREGEGLRRLDWRVFTLVRCAGLGIGVTFAMLPASWTGERPPLGDPILTWVMFRSALLGWAVAVTAHLEIDHGLRFARLGRCFARVDLLDTMPLRPFGRQGLRSVAVWLGLSVLFSLLFLAPWGREAATVFSIAFALLAGIALWLPARGVHARTVEAKTIELARLRDAISKEREANLAGVAGVDARLSNLIAYRGLLESVATWPFDFSTWLRFAVYVLLGLGSWLGGAVVERVVGSVLGS